MNREIEIPEGYEARIEGNKVIIEQKESEDERVRRNIIAVVEWNSELTQSQKAEIYAWLEKQKEQKPNVIIPKFRIGDTIRLKGSMAEYTIESIDAECYHGKGWGLPISAEDDYELVEPKLAEWSEEDEKF